MSDVDRDTWHEDGDERQGRAHSSAVRDAAGRPEQLSFPRVSGRLVPRIAPLQRLERLAPFTVVEALPGFGKTTLAAAWARAHVAAGSHVVWIKATPELDEPTAFLDLLRLGLERAGVVSPSPSPCTGSDDLQAWVEEVAGADRVVLVVVDDAHHLRSPTVVDGVLRLVHEAQPLHVAVLAEADHPFRQAAARHGLETNVLRGSDLTIQAHEVVAFAEAWGHPLSVDAGHRLHRLVGGWLLALRLVLDSTPSWSDGFATHVAEEFLISRVLPDIADTAELAMAMRFAVPERIDVRLAAALVGDDPDSAAAALDELANLERQGLLWRSSRHDGQAEWRYPKLVRRALLKAFEHTHPAAARAAHRSVALVLTSERGRRRSSQLLQHARASGDWAVLAGLWVEHGWSLAGADPEAFELAYSQIPAGVLKEHPSLTMAATLGKAFTATRDSAWMTRVDTVLQQYMQAGTDLVRSGQQTMSPTWHAEMLTAAMVARRSVGHLAEARQLGVQASRELDRARLIEPTRLRTSQVAWFHLQNAITQLHSGDYGRMFEAATTAHQLGPNNLVGAGAAALLAAMHTVSGQGRDARKWLASHESTDITGHWAAGLAELPARLARAMLALDRLDAKTAEAELAEVPLGPEASGLWPLVVVVHARYELLFGDPATMLFRLEHLTRVLARHMNGDAGLARQVFDRYNAELLLALGEANRLESRLGGATDLPPWLTVPAARFHLMTGNPAKAAQLAIAGTWRDDVLGRDRLELTMISALAWRMLGAIEQAAESFRRAHALSVESGNHQPWSLLPDDARDEVLRSLDLELDPDVVDSLEGLRRVYPDHVELVRLSQRELEVLRQFRHHNTAADLAKTLSVSINTVKKQMISLYGKLGVHDRSSALLRAQRLGLIDDGDEARLSSPRV